MSPTIARLPNTAIVSALLALTACTGGSNGTSQGGTPTNQVAAPAPAPTPTPTPTNTQLDVLPCLTQELSPDLNRAPPGTRIIDLIIPDTLTIYPDRVVQFPNGRKLDDPVVDITLGVILLDLTAPGQNAGSFAAIPMNPEHATKTPRSVFPYVNAPNGNPPIDPGTGTNFRFDDTPMSGYVQVDRFGMPAVSTALILSPAKNAYNDGNVQMDTANAFAFNLIEGLRVFSTQLQDDLQRMNLKGCGVLRPSS